MSDTTASDARMRGTVHARTTSELTALLEREAPALLDYFGRRCRSAEDAADLLSELFLVVWRRTSAVPADDTEARMWMFGCARKVLLTHRRALARRARLASKLQHGSALQSVGDDHEHLRELIDALGEPDREIIRMVYWEGFSLVEVSRILGMREATTRSRLARARTRLREQLDDAR